MSIFKEPIRSEIKGQISKRQNIMEATTRTPQQLTWLNSRNSWIRMTSSVEVNNDGGALARNYVLQGGTLNTAVKNNAISSTLKTGVGDFTNAYSPKDWSNTNHRLGIRPMPGITGLEVKSRGAYGSLREATITFQCWDILQLEDLEVLYMRPGYSVLVEWGWSPYINNSGNLVNNIDLIDSVILGSGNKEAIWKEIFKKNADTYGNYDAVYGIIKNYSWKARGDGGYDCTTTLITIGEVLESLKINYSATTTSVPQKGIPDWEAEYNALFGGVAFPLSNYPDEFVTKAYQQSTIAGMLAELNSLIDIPNWRSGYALYPDKQTSTISLGGYNYTIARYDITISDYPQNINGTDFEKNRQYYILLSDFMDMLNRYILIEDTKSGNPYAEVSLREGFHMQNPGRPLLCLGNRYQFSTNPLICLIDNPDYENPTNLGYDTSCTDVSTLMKGLKGGMYDFSSTSFTTNYFWDGAGSNSKEYGIIGNIYVNIAHLYSLVADENLENLDKKEKKDINLFDFLKTLMKDINDSIGGVSNFEIFVDPQDSIIRIIDVNYVNPENVTNIKNNAPVIELQNTKSTARNYSFESQIFPEQSTIVAIGAQAEGGQLGENVNTLIDFNQNLRDRIIPKKIIPTAATAPIPADRQKNIQQNFTQLSKYMCQLDPDWWEYVGDFNVTEASKYSHALKDLINLILEEPTLGGLNNKAIIPTKLSIEMDGLGGLIIGNLFKINDDIIPRGYSGNLIGADIGYIVTGINHSVTNGDWVTKLDSQFVILDNPKPTNNAITAVTPPVPASGAIASSNVNINGVVYLGSVKVNYTVTLDQARQQDTKVQFEHILTFTNGKQMPVQVEGTIPAGNTSTTIEVTVSETLSANDLVNTNDYNNIGATIEDTSFDVVTNTQYTQTPLALTPIAPFAPTKKTECPEFPSDKNEVLKLVIQALDNKNYHYYTDPYHVNMVGIRNSDKDYGANANDVEGKAISPNNPQNPPPPQATPPPPTSQITEENKKIANEIISAAYPGVTGFGTVYNSFVNAIAKIKTLEQFNQIDSYLKTQTDNLNLESIINSEMQRKGILTSSDLPYVKQIKTFLNKIPGIIATFLEDSDYIEGSFKITVKPPPSPNKPPTPKSTTATKFPTKNPHVLGVNAEGACSTQQGFLGVGKPGKSFIDKFTDWLVCWYYDEKGEPHIEVGKATTVPGKKYQSPGGKFWNNLGRNITLLEGYWKNFYNVGTHGGGTAQPNCLVTNKKYTSKYPIYRMDFKLDATYMFNGFYEGDKGAGTGTYRSAGINNPYRTDDSGSSEIPSTNIHASGPGSDESKKVNGWSAGCQVWRDQSKKNFMSTAILDQKEKTERGNNFDYVLLHVRDLPGFENCFDAVTP